MTVRVTLRRRLVRLTDDYDRLLEMHRLSWRINFPGQRFDEWVFRATLESSARLGDVYAYERGACDGDVVAWLWLSWPTPESGHVRHIQVAQEYWGQGIGRRVLEDAVALCVERGREALTLVVTKENARAMALYKGLGFRVERDEGTRQRMRLEFPQGTEAQAAR